MGIISRFKDIMASNINAILDKMEDPEKMIDQYLRDLEKDLGQVKSETAAVMAEEKAAKRKLDECNSEITKMDEYARKAIMSGDDAAAKQFLTKKSDLTTQQVVYEQQYAICAENAMKMREMHDKLTADISSLQTRRETLKAKIKVAETQQKINKMTSPGSALNNLGKFDEMEEKINKKLDQAEAMTELNKSSQESSIDNLMAKYNDSHKDSEVDAELAALKASMGLTTTQE